MSAARREVRRGGIAVLRGSCRHGHVVNDAPPKRIDGLLAQRRARCAVEVHRPRDARGRTQGVKRRRALAPAATPVSGRRRSGIGGSQLLVRQRRKIAAIPGISLGGSLPLFSIGPAPLRGTGVGDAGGLPRRIEEARDCDQPRRGLPQNGDPLQEQLTCRAILLMTFATILNPEPGR